MIRTSLQRPPEPPGPLRRRTSRRALAASAWLLLATPPVAAAPPAPPPAAASDPVPLHAGDTVRFELSRLPDGFEGEGKAVCVGTRFDSTGPVEARCERPFRFDVPADDARIVFTFRPAKGGREDRIALPMTRTAKPVTFVAPSDGSLLSPPPTPFPQEVADRAARKAAQGKCAECRGSDFSLASFEVTRKPGPPDGELPVRLAITPAPPPAAK